MENPEFGRKECFSCHQKKLLVESDLDSSWSYDLKYDAFYCSICNIWLDSTCSDLNCEYCKNRPPTPFEKKSINL